MKSRNKAQKHTIPLSMSRADRNERVYKRLLSMGLFVAPVFRDDQKEFIDHFIVATGIPSRVCNYGQDQELG